jgi:hypothetical protein
MRVSNIALLFASCPFKLRVRYRYFAISFRIVKEKNKYRFCKLIKDL